MCILSLEEWVFICVGPCMENKQGVLIGWEWVCHIAPEENKPIACWWCCAADSILQNYTTESLACRLNMIITSCPPDWLKNKAAFAQYRVHLPSFRGLIVLVQFAALHPLWWHLCPGSIVCLDAEGLLEADANPLFGRQATHASHAFDCGDYSPAFVRP